MPKISEHYIIKHIISNKPTQYLIYSVIGLFILFCFILLAFKEKTHDDNFDATRTEFLEYQEAMKLILPFDEELKQMHAVIMFRLNDPKFTLDMFSDRLDRILIPVVENILGLFETVRPRSHEIRIFHEKMVEIYRTQSSIYKKMSVAASLRDKRAIVSLVDDQNRTKRLFREAQYEYIELCEKYNVPQAYGN